MTMNDGTAIEVGERSLSEQTIEAIRRGVVKYPPNMAGEGNDDGLLYMVAQAADDIPAWGHAPTYRDRKLRQFLTTESVVTSAFASIIARNSAYSWKLDGPGAAVDAGHEILETANGGEGWVEFIIKVCWDLYCQDKGAFVQIIRMADSPEAPVIGIQSLDAIRCWHTGNPLEPVVYQDINGKWTRFKYFEIFTLREMPAPHERLYGMQYSALTRVLRAAEIFRNISTYIEEKTGGRFNRAIHVVSNVQKSELEAALKTNQMVMDSVGVARYIQPVILATLKADAKPEVATLELANLPDNFDSEEEFKRYIAVLALGLLTDYQEFAPLPGGNLGTSAQSQVLRDKSRGKGPGLFMKLISYKLNFAGVLPRSVQFAFDEQDIEAEESEAQVRKARAEGRQIMRMNGEIDEAGARQIALDDGDLSQELFDLMNAKDVTGPERRDEAVDPAVRPAGTGTAQPGETRVNDTQPAGGAPVGGTAKPQGERSLPATLLLFDQAFVGLKADAETTIRDFLGSRLHRAFTTAADDMRSLGYMTTDERIALSGLIGDVLQYASDTFGDEAAEIVARNLDIEDQRLMVAAAKELDPALAGPDAERLAIEEALAAPLTRALARVGGHVRSELRAQEGTRERGEVPAAPVTRPAVVEKVVRDQDGNMKYRVVERRVELAARGDDEPGGPAVEKTVADAHGNVKYRVTERVVER